MTTKPIPGRVKEFYGKGGNKIGEVMLVKPTMPQNGMAGFGDGIVFVTFGINTLPLCDQEWGRWHR